MINRLLVEKKQEKSLVIRKVILNTKNSSFRAKIQGNEVAFNEKLCLLLRQVVKI